MNKFTVDKDLCIGCGTCAALGSGSFTMTEDGKAEALENPTDDDGTIQAAVDSCPVGAIKLSDLVV
ncbi:MAG: ferredoxin [Candidatus Magasanikbacteria bacterium]